jgi:hypothetical protein
MQERDAHKCETYLSLGSWRDPCTPSGTYSEKRTRKPSRISFTRKNNGPPILELGLECPEEASKMGVTGISVCIKMLISLVPRSSDEEVTKASKEG